MTDNSEARKKEAASYMAELAKELDDFIKIHSGDDTPEGVQSILLSKTLAEQIVGNLRYYSEELMR